MMKFGISLKRTDVFLVAVLLPAILFSAGCAPAAEPTLSAAATTAAPSIPPPATQVESQAASPTPSAEAAASPTAGVTRPAEAAASPTATAAQPTAAPTDTKTAATTPETMPASQTGFSAWCLPLEVSVSNAKDPLNPPASAKKAKATSNGLEVRGLPANGCVFMYTFSGQAPGGLKLEISELNQPKPFLTTELKAAEGKPETAWAFVRHSVITSPPAERIGLTFVVRDPLGQVLRRDQVRLVSWMPGTPEPKEGDDDCGCGPILP